MVEATTDSPLVVSAGVGDPQQMVTEQARPFPPHAGLRPSHLLAQHPLKVGAQTH